MLTILHIGQGPKSLEKVLLAYEVMLRLAVLRKSIAVIFLLNNCEELLHRKSYSHFFSKNGMYSRMQQPIQSSRIY